MNEQKDHTEEMTEPALLIAKDAVTLTELFADPNSADLSIRWTLINPDREAIVDDGAQISAQTQPKKKKKMR